MDRAGDFRHDFFCGSGQITDFTPGKSRRKHYGFIDITKLNAEIEEIVLREAELRDAIRNIIEEIEGGI